MTFGQQLKELRKEKGLSQDALAGMLYVTRQSVSQWETDKSMPSVDLLVKLSQIFDTTVDKLLGKEDAPEEPLCSATLLTKSKDMQSAARFRFCSTVTILLAVAAATVYLTVTALQLNPPIYQNLPYFVPFSQMADRVLVAAGCIIAAVVFIVLRLRYAKRAAAFAQQLTGDVLFFTDHFVLSGADGTSTAFFYANLRRVSENDIFLYITLPNKQTIILDKTAAGDGMMPVLQLLSLHKHYKRKRIVQRSCKSVNALYAVQILNNVLFVAAVTFAVRTFTIQIALRTNADIPQVCRWGLFLLPWIVAAAVLTTGIAECVRKIRAKRLLICGAAVLAFLGVFSVITGLFTVFNFNQRALQASEFLAVMEKHHFTVTETNRDNPDDFLWECYTAKNADSSIEITFMHFQQEPRWDAVRAARGAYDRLYSRELAKTNNYNFGTYFDFYVNAYQVFQSQNGRFCYLSINRYTVLCISTTEEHKKDIDSIFAEYQLAFPY